MRKKGREGKLDGIKRGMGGVKVGLDRRWISKHYSLCVPRFCGSDTLHN